MRCRERTNVRSETTNANVRTARTLSRLKRRISNAPTVGVNVMIVRMYESSMIAALPQKPRDDQNAAEQDPTRIRPHISGLHTSEHTAGEPHQSADTVDAAVDQNDVHKFPEKLPRHPHNRPDDDGVINLIDVVLVNQE